MPSKLLAAIVTGALMFATAAATFAADATDAAEAPATIKTVFVDGKGQSSFADKVDKSHAEMTAKGWKFASLAVYDEDGDMQGAFVTYTR
jgi:hypothetical protein